MSRFLLLELENEVRSIKAGSHLFSGPHVETKYAWIPVRLDSRKIVWLEEYIEVTIMFNVNVNPYPFLYKITTAEWVTIKLKT